MFFIARQLSAQPYGAHAWTEGQPDVLLRVAAPREGVMLPSSSLLLFFGAADCGDSEIVILSSVYDI
jgi:hypothetical protein